MSKGTAANKTSRLIPKGNETMENSIRTANLALLVKLLLSGPQKIYIMYDVTPLKIIDISFVCLCFRMQTSGSFSIQTVDSDVHPLGSLQDL